MMRKIMLLVFILAIISKPSAQAIVNPAYDFSVNRESILHNSLRIIVGEAIMVIPCFALIIADNSSPIFFFPFAAAVGVYGTGRIQKYDGKLWATLCGAYCIGLPWALLLNNYFENPKQNDGILNAYLIVNLLLPVFANFGFNLSTKNKEKVLKVSLFGSPSKFSTVTLDDSKCKRINAGFSYKVNIITLNF